MVTLALALLQYVFHLIALPSPPPPPPRDPATLRLPSYCATARRYRRAVFLPCLAGSSPVPLPSPPLCPYPCVISASARPALSPDSSPTLPGALTSPPYTLPVSRGVCLCARPDPSRPARPGSTRLGTARLGAARRRPHPVTICLRGAVFATDRAPQGWY